jgi:DNA-binding YbaB/EbfC family protein
MNIQQMMKQAKKMQAEMDVKRQELAKQEFTVEKQGVTIKIMGDKKIVAIDINEFLVDPDDKETLEDLMIIAFNDAIALIDAEEEKLSPAQPNMPI